MTTEPIDHVAQAAKELTNSDEAYDAGPGIWAALCSIAHMLAAIHETLRDIEATQRISATQRT